MNEDVNTEVTVESNTEDLVEETTAAPAAIREFREELGLSRKDVEKHTELSSSVVWRSEQTEGKPVTAEQRTKIWDFLIAVDSDDEYRAIVKPAKTPKPTTSQAPTVDVTKYVNFISELDDAIKAAIAERKAKKAGVKDLNTLLEMITNFNF